jgi:hypothetical protein
MTSQRKTQRHRGAESGVEVECRRIEQQINMLKFEMARAVSSASRTWRSRVRPSSSVLVRTSHFDSRAYSLWPCVSVVCLSITFVSLQKERDLD